MAQRKDPREQADETRRQQRNEDPITKEPGAHPLGAGSGAAIGGAALGAAAGSVAGPAGTVAGAVVGGIAGGLAGKAIAENVNPTLESDYWRENYRSRPYYTDEYEYDDYAPAYRMGWESYTNDARDWASVEPDVRRRWQEERWENEGGAPPMSWEEARYAARDAYERVASRRDTSVDPHANNPPQNKPR